MNDNKLIAEFMGFPHRTDAVDDRTIAYYVGEVIINTDNTENENEDDVFHPDDMQFHSSWDWLTPVISKIVEDYGEGWSFEEGYDLEVRYQAVVEFIKEHNK
tara:strand:- start:245 stop:550 length:306 start_codon:yes stop_codon:yes gene_type:complete